MDNSLSLPACNCRPDPLVFGHHCPPSPAAGPGTLVRVIACTPDCRRQHEQPRVTGRRMAWRRQDVHPIPAGGMS